MVEISADGVEHLIEALAVGGDEWIMGEHEREAWWPPLEHAIHELSHMVLLGLVPAFDGSDAGTLITKTLEALGPQQQQAMEEARTWAVEFTVCKALGLPLTAGEVADGSDDQGVPRAWLNRALEEDRTEEAVTVIGWLATQGLFV
jgi:hypothetical protein